MAKVTPVNWTAFIQEALVRKANIFSMGLVQQDTSSIITQGGKYFVRPYQENLAEIAAPVVYNASTTITPTTASDFQENLVVCHIGDGYYETEYDRITRGSNGLDALMIQRSTVILNKLQDWMISTIKGAFASALATSHVYDASVVGSGTMGTFAVTQGAQTLFGEQMNDFDAYIMNSVTYAELVANGTASMEYASDFSNTMLATGKIPTFLGKRILVNDTLCEATTSNGATVYPVYVIQGQPFYLAWQRNVRTYEKFVPETGGGRYETYWYADFVPAVKGVSWTHTSYDPTQANLETAGYWTKVFENKLITMFKILVKPTPIS